jgi:hypothetical protein
MNKILKTTKLVADNSKFVQINNEKLLEFSKGFRHEEKNHWLSQAPFDFGELNTDEELKFTFIFNALSFCYWGEPKWTIEHNGKKYDGAWGLVVALGRAIRQGFPLIDFEYISKISDEDFSKILQGNVEIPLFKERLNVLHEIGSIICKKYNGDLDSFVKLAEGDALKLLDLLVAEFPSFYDSSPYQGKEIFFHKRAQLLVSDICQMFKRQKLASKNADKLTACADYKIPQILRRFGIFEYSDELINKIDNKIELPHNSEEEIEIRANTIWAIEMMKEDITERDPNITSMEIDDHLWLASQEKTPDEKPYHRTRTTAY